MARPKKVEDKNIETIDEVVETPVVESVKTPKEEPKFNYLIALRGDNTPLQPYSHNGLLFYGNQDEADAMLKYATEHGYRGYEIIKVK